MRLVSLALLGVLAVPALAAELPEWAYPVNHDPKPRDATTLISLPGSYKKYTQTQIDDGFNPPDWYPADHKAMPDVVAHGRKEADIRACALCHLTNGAGHPETAAIAGLPTAYFLRQMAEFKSGARSGSNASAMINIAKTISEADVKAAAAYYSSQRYSKWYKVVESDTVPKSYVGNGGMRLAVENGGTEPLGDRIIELPEDNLSAESRDSRRGFIAHVPPGSLKKGESIVVTGGGKVPPCNICHGPDLRGLMDVPQIVGRSPTYVFRQLNDVKMGNRTGVRASMMKAVGDNLEPDDMIAIAAYLASQGR
jgi:cytochrome c553